MDHKGGIAMKHEDGQFKWYQLKCVDALDGGDVEYMTANDINLDAIFKDCQNRSGSSNFVCVVNQAEYNEKRRIGDMRYLNVKLNTVEGVYGY